MEYLISDLDKKTKNFLEDPQTPIKVKLALIKCLKEHGYKMFDGRLWHSLKRQDIENLYKEIFSHKFIHFGIWSGIMNNHKEERTITLGSGSIFFVLEVVICLAEKFPDFNHEDFFEQFNKIFFIFEEGMEDGDKLSDKLVEGELLWAFNVYIQGFPSPLEDMEVSQINDLEHSIATMEIL